METFEIGKEHGHVLVKVTHFSFSGRQLKVAQ